MIDTDKLRTSHEHLTRKVGVFATKVTLNEEDIGHLHTILWALPDLCQIAILAASLRELLDKVEKVGPEPDHCG